MAKNKIIIVKGISIATFKQGEDDFISLTDITRNKNADEPQKCGKKLDAFQNYH
jgi:hypothetical protein